MREFHSTTRIDGVIALPFDVTFTLSLGGCDMYVQFLPADTYQWIYFPGYVANSSTDQLKNLLSHIGVQGSF